MYIGLRCEDSKVKDILDAVKDKPEVSVYRMKISDRDIYSIEPELIREGTKHLQDGQKTGNCFCRCICKCIKKTYNQIRNFLNKFI